VEIIESLGPLYNKWYMDDGGIVAPPEVLVKVWAALNTLKASLSVRNLTPRIASADSRTISSNLTACELQSLRGVA
jgi:hypothetical protein